MNLACFLLNFVINELAKYRKNLGDKMNYLPQSAQRSLSFFKMSPFFPWDACPVGVEG